MDDSLSVILSQLENDFKKGEDTLAALLGVTRRDQEHLGGSAGALSLLLLSLSPSLSVCRQVRDKQEINSLRLPTAAPFLSRDTDANYQ